MDKDTEKAKIVDQIIEIVDNDGIPEFVALEMIRELGQKWKDVK